MFYPAEELWERIQEAYLPITVIGGVHKSINLEGGGPS